MITILGYILAILLLVVLVAGILLYDYNLIRRLLPRRKHKHLKRTK